MEGLFLDVIDPSPPSEDGAGEYRTLSSISTEMVRIYKDQFGRGPTKVRTEWAGHDTLVVTLEQTLTRAELKLRDLGEHGRLRDLRLLFQYSEVDSYCDPVERLTGRKVRSFISGIDTVADVALEMFILHPAGHDGPSRSRSAPVPRGEDVRPRGST